VGPEVSGSTAEAARAEAARRFLWARLMPTGHCVGVRDVPMERVLALQALLKEEGVSPLQMRLARGRDRRYPGGDLEIFGSWGRIRGDEPEPLPRDGLELLAEHVFDDGILGLAAPLPSAYAFVVQRNQSLGRTQYFVDSREAEAAPRVITTLDLDLLRTVRHELELVMETHAPALAMAIAIDLASGDVLAVDSIEKYPVQPFAPVYYAFTPGSTFKVLTMALALEAGAVRPDEGIDVGDGSANRLPECKRTIREAEGSRSGVISAAECLAYSMNIGLVRIGQRLDDGFFRGKLLELGYARVPQAGLGPEHPGMLPPLPWGKNWEQASVSFGHEVMTTLWQHAAGLAAVARGGLWRPLRLLAAVEQGGMRHELPLDPGRSVLSPEACATVRSMMAMGADVGTGRRTKRPGLVLGTKTGTAEKVPSEVCAHVAGAARAAAEAAGRTFGGQDYEALRGLPRPHKRSCYTSSMCIVGRRAAGGGEVLVLVVVDEPTGKQKFGSDVAGPAAVNILADALGATQDGSERTLVLDSGFALAGELDLANPLDQPWRPR
jgi:cell division protein FtsI/penicillin-binding protein 2